MQDKITLPKTIQKYFWGDNLRELNWEKHQKYIIQTLLEKGDSNAIHWLFSVTNKKELQSMLPQLRLEKKSANFWSIYLS